MRWQGKLAATVCNDNGVTIMMISAATSDAAASIQGLDGISGVWEQRQ